MRRFIPFARGCAGRAATIVLLLGGFVSSAKATLLVYEPFNYLTGTPSGSGVLLRGQDGAALGLTGSWNTYNFGGLGGTNSVTVYPQGTLSGVNLSTGAANVFNGTVANLSTSGGYVGPIGLGGTAVTTDHIQIWRSLDPSVTATFTAGSTTWFSVVTARGFNNVASSPKFAIGAAELKEDRGHLANGEAIGAGGGIVNNLSKVYPHFWDEEVTGSGVFNDFDIGGKQAGTGSSTNHTVPTADSFTWETTYPDSTQSVPNIIVGKIVWSDSGADVISAARFLQTDTLSETAFNTIAKSSAGWTIQPNLDQSQFDTISVGGGRYFVDEIRIATTFNEVVGAAAPPSTGLYWAPAVGGGGSSTWNSTSNVWAQVANTQGVYAQGTNGPLVFAGALGTATVSGTVSVVAGMQFTTNGYTIAGSTPAAVVLAGSSAAVNTVTVGSGMGATISAPLAGVNGLTKAGNGTLTLDGTSTYSGGTVLAAGNLQVAGPDSLGSGNLDFQGGTLRYPASNTADLSGKIPTVAAGQVAKIDTNANDVTFASPIGGAGALTKLGNGTLSLASSNSYAGPTRVAAGGLSVAHQNALQASTLDMNDVDAGAVVFATGVTAATVGGLSGGRNLTLQTGAAQPVTLSVGNNHASTVYNGVLSGSGGLTKVGSGTLTLTGNHTYAGATTVNAGVLKLQAPATPPVANYQLWLDAMDLDTLTLSGGTNVTNWNNKGVNGGSFGIGVGTPSFAATGINGHPTVWFNSPGNQNQYLISTNAYNNTTNTMTLFLVEERWSGTAYGGAISFIGSNSNYDNNNVGNLSTEDTGGYLQTVRNSTTLSQITRPADTVPFTWDTVFNGSSNASYLSGGTGGSITPTAGNVVSSSGTFNINTVSLGVRFNSGTTSPGDFNNSSWHGKIGEVLIYNAALSDAQRQNVEAYLNYKWFGIGSGLGGGGGANFLPAGTQLAVNGGTLDLNGNSQTVASLSGAGALRNSNTASLGTTLTVGDGSNLDSSFSGTISDAGAKAIRLVMAGTGTLALTGTGAIQGSTNVPSGTLQVNGAWTTSVLNVTSLGGDEGAGRLAGNGTITLTGDYLYYYSTAASTFAGHLASTTADSGVEVVGGLLTLAGSNSYRGDTAVDHGGGATLRMATANALPYGPTAGNVIVDGDGVLDLAGFVTNINGLRGTGNVDTSAGTATLVVGNRDATSTFSGTIKNSAGSLALLKTGSGALTLSGTNTFNGGTTVEGGTLVLAGAGALLDGSSLTVGTSASLVFGPPLGPPVAGAPVAVPEPGTLALLTAAGLLAAARRRKRR